MKSNTRVFFEVTKEQRELAAIGQRMMDFSEYFPNLGRLKDPQMAQLNELSRVGNMLTAYGAPWGTTRKDFTDADMQLIAGFMKGELETQKL